jgi:hypothetical protein
VHLARSNAVADRPADDHALLDQEVDGVAFPSWARAFGWTATGVRSDRLDGRRATTVFYEKQGQRVAYTIVSGVPLDGAVDVASVRRKGVDLASLPATAGES